MQHIADSLASGGTRGEPGTGLGLNVCKEMITRMGGTITVESTVGQGTTFTFTLPCVAQEEHS